MKTAAGIELDRREGTVKIFGKAVKVEQHLEELGTDERPQTIRAMVPFQIKSVNDEERTIEFVGSTATQDRYGDSIVQGGWELGNFVKNPVIPWGHDYSEPPVAVATEVGLKDGNLTFKGKFPSMEEMSADPANPSERAKFTDFIYRMYKGGYLRAFSVGFIPKEYDGNWQDGYTFTQAELLEVSAVTVPANPEALMLAFKEGAASPDERRILMGQAQRLMKALTESGDDEQNEDMETAKAVNELKELLLGEIGKLKEQNAAIEKMVAELRGEAPAEGEEPTEENAEAEGDEPVDGEAEASDKPADEPAGGADEGAEAETKGLKLTADDIRAAVKDAAHEVLDYQLGKIK